MSSPWTVSKSFQIPLFFKSPMKKSLWKKKTHPRYIKTSGPEVPKTEVPRWWIRGNPTCSMPWGLNQNLNLNSAFRIHNFQAFCCKCSKMLATTPISRKTLYILNPTKPVPWTQPTTSNQPTTNHHNMLWTRCLETSMVPFPPML